MGWGEMGGPADRPHGGAAVGAPHSTPADLQIFGVSPCPSLMATHWGDRSVTLEWVPPAVGLRPSSPAPHPQTSPIGEGCVTPQRQHKCARGPTGTLGTPRVPQMCPAPHRYFTYTPDMPCNPRIHHTPAQMCHAPCRCAQHPTNTLLPARCAIHSPDVPSTPRIHHTHPRCAAHPTDVPYTAQTCPVPHGYITHTPDVPRSPRMCHTQPRCPPHPTNTSHTLRCVAHPTDVPHTAQMCPVPHGYITHSQMCHTPPDVPCST